MLKEKTLTLTDNGKQLTFKVKQMPAMQRSKWATKAGLLLAASGKDVDISRLDLNAIVGAMGYLDYDRLEPLLTELLACCWRVVERAETQVTPETCEAYIEDEMTVFTLYKEAFRLNFLSGGGLSDYLGNLNTAEAKEK